MNGRAVNSRKVAADGLTAVDSAARLNYVTDLLGQLLRDRVGGSMRQLKHPRVIESARHLEHYLREYSTALTEVSHRAAQSTLLWRQVADDRREFYDDSEYLSARL